MGEKAESPTSPVARVAPAPTEIDDHIPDWARGARGADDALPAATAARAPAVNEGPSAGATSAPVSFPMLPGELARSYVLLADMESSGNEADIFLVRRADDVATSPRRLVLKLYRPKRAPSAEVLLAIGGLDEAYVVKQIEVGEENGRSYEILEHLPAGSLDSLLASEASRSPEARGRLLAPAAQQMTAILDYLHGLPQARTLVHRDIKPANILIRATDPLALVVADFGTARMLEFEEAGTVFAGTRSYTAPEGQSDTHGGAVVVSPALDWWSLGIILFEIAAGSHPFDGLSGAERHQLLKGQIGFRFESLLPELADWAGLLAGLLQRDPKWRWSGMQARAWLERDPATRAAGQLLAAAEQRLGKTTAVPGVRPFEFLGTLYSDERKLGRALALYWDQAVTRLGRGAILKWLEGEPSKNDAASMLQDLELKTVQGEKLTVEQQLIEFLLYLDPNAMPERDRDRRHRHETIKLCLQAEAGLASAQAAVARMLLEGAVLQPDQPRAEELANAAARQGDAAGQALAEEIARFRRAREKAAGDKDDLAALLEVARCQEAGQGVVRDPVAAQRNYERAADLGHVEAQWELGLKAFTERRYDVAAARLEQAAAQGHSNALNHLGVMYLDGLGPVAQHDAKAVELFRLSAEAGDPWAMNNLSYCLYEERGCARDEPQIYLWSQRAADAGQGRGQYYAGLCHMNGIGTPVDQKRAVGLFGVAWENGFVAAGYQLGRAYEFGYGVAQSYREASDRYFAAAQRDHAPSSYKLGQFWLRHEELFGTEGDPAEAAACFRKAAEAGHAEAQYELGVLLQEGKGVPENIGEAVTWFERAAGQGVAWAQYRLGYLCHNGAPGVSQDVGRAAKFYRLAAEQGVAAAQNNLGLLYRLGFGVEQDMIQAMLWYGKAADQNFVLSIRNLAEIHRFGLGEIPKNLAESRRRYRQLAENHPDALAEAGQCYRALTVENDDDDPPDIATLLGQPDADASDGLAKRRTPAMPGTSGDGTLSDGGPTAAPPHGEESPDARTPDTQPRSLASTALRQERFWSICVAAFGFALFVLVQLLLIKAGFDAVGSAMAGLSKLGVRGVGDLVSNIAALILVLIGGALLLAYAAVAVFLLAKQTLDLFGALLRTISDLTAPEPRPHAQAGRDPGNEFVASAKQEWLSVVKFAADVVVAILNRLLSLFGGKI